MRLSDGAGRFGMGHYSVAKTLVQEIEKNIVETKPDILIHTAALINVEECERNQINSANSLTKIGEKSMSVNKFNAFPSIKE